MSIPSIIRIRLPVIELNQADRRHSVHIVQITDKNGIKYAHRLLQDTLREAKDITYKIILNFNHTSDISVKYNI
jgi:hypothetical protein